jgi:hypothetical protein
VPSPPLLVGLRPSHVDFFNRHSHGLIRCVYAFDDRLILSPLE